uniref:Uncharacterized protein n=1 Tax=Noctiluca scintillans TaxID=2966 RepID=A0A7S1AZW6_NOCSC|mmetsp:Transcript_7215/g.19732  ORF Transcript_7215/g.19732 Transcript_7215/m.19732 type:complete len:512 (+) Transcript_7215:49-1584(+)
MDACVSQELRAVLARRKCIVEKLPPEDRDRTPLIEDNQNDLESESQCSDRLCTDQQSLITTAVSQESEDAAILRPSTMQLLSKLVSFAKELDNICVGERRGEGLQRRRAARARSEYHLHQLSDESPSWEDVKVAMVDGKTLVRDSMDDVACEASARIVRRRPVAEQLLDKALEQRDMASVVSAASKARQLGISQNDAERMEEDGASDGVFQCGRLLRCPRCPYPPACNPQDATKNRGDEATSTTSNARQNVCLEQINAKLAALQKQKDTLDKMPHVSQEEREDLEEACRELRRRAMKLTKIRSRVRPGHEIGMVVAELAGDLVELELVLQPLCAERLRSKLPRPSDQKTTLAWSRNVMKEALLQELEASQSRERALSMIECHVRTLTVVEEPTSQQLEDAILAIVDLIDVVRCVMDTDIRRRQKVMVDLREAINQRSESGLMLEIVQAQRVGLDSQDIEAAEELLAELRAADTSQDETARTLRVLSEPRKRQSKSLKMKIKRVDSSVFSCA